MDLSTILERMVVSMKKKFNNLKEVIAYNCKNREHKIIILEKENEHEEIAGNNLKNQIFVLIKIFENNRIQPGDYVILQMERKKHFFLSLLALIYMGAIPIVLPVSSNKEQYKRFQKIKDENPLSHLICDKVGKEYIELFGEEKVSNLIILSDEVFKQKNLINKNQVTEFYNNVEKIENEVVLVLYSSGSTSEPKGIMLTNEAIMDLLNAARNEFNSVEVDVFMTWLPIVHSLGLIYFTFLPLLNCSEIIYFEASRFAQNPKSWFDIMEKYNVTISAAPNFAFRIMTNSLNMNDLWDLSTVRIIFNAGEPISKKVTRDFIEVTKKFSLNPKSVIPAYGLTESTSVVICCYNNAGTEVEFDQLKSYIDFDIKNLEILKDDLICQGTPLKGSKVRIVNDEYELLSEYSVGNIQIGGNHLCKGYLNKDSSELFTNGWLNTGDIGFIVKGCLYIIGRKKDMFFLNGKNIYLRDIEQIIKDQFGVRNAACGENISAKGKSFIYLFLEMDLSQDDIKRQKKEIQQMVLKEAGIKIEDVIFMDKLLMTQIGKISKPELLKKYKESKKESNEINLEYIRNDKDIIDLLCEIFNENFSSKSLIFNILDDSLKMLKNIGRINQYFQIELGMIDIAKCETIGDLVDRIQDRKTVNHFGSKVKSYQEQFPLTFMQQAYYLGRHQEFYGNKNGTHMYFEIQHEMNLEEVEECIRQLIKRHDMLRTIFLEDQQKILRVEETANYKIKTITISQAEEKEFFINKRRLNQTVIHDPSKWPLFEITNINIDGVKNIAIIDLDLIIADSMSLHILLRDFMMLYQNKKLPEIESGYKEYIEYLIQSKGSTKYVIDKNFWKEKISNFPLAPKLPVKRGNKENNIYERVEKSFSIAEWKKVENFSNQIGVTVSVILCYLYMKTLEKWSENSDFAINITVLDRPSSIPGIDKVVGDFTTNVLFDYRTAEYSSENIIEDMKKVRDKLYTYFDHNAFEGIEVIREIAKTQKIREEGLMPMVFTSMLFGKTPNFRLGKILYSRSQTSQVSLDNQIHRLNDKYMIIWDYLGKLYNHHVITDMFKYYCDLIQNIIDDHICAPIEIAGENKILSYNNTDTVIEKRTLDVLLENRFSLYQDEKAICDRCYGSITYDELKNKTNYLIAKFQRMGIQKGDYVVVLTHKCANSIAVIIALVRMGAVYIPVPADYPSERIEFIKKDSRCKFLLDSNDIFETLDRGTPDQSKLGLCQFDDPAYVIYTSGSTGTPKGVEISHGGVVNTIHDMNQRFSINKQDTMLGISSLNFDLSVFDIFGTLLAGGCLALIQEPRDSLELKESIEHNNATIWNSVPAFMELFLESQDEDYINDSMRCILLSGDWIHVTLPNRIKKHFPKADIISLGGATEASIWSIYYKIVKVNPEWESIPYGYPLNNQKIYIFNKNMEICPMDVVGEIYIGGLGVATQYLGDDKKTKEAFINTKKYGRLYKTGDFGKFSRGGYVIFLGRKDGQVKVGGHRIELEEIENQLRRIPQISDAIVIVDEHKKIVAYYTGSEELELDTIKNILEKFLPEYMIPYQCTKIESIPLNANGKVDRKLLPKGIKDVVVPKEALPMGPIEQKMIQIWSEILNAKNISVNDDFFDLGGDSITAQRMRQRIIKEFDIKIPFTTIINEGSVRKLSNIIKNNNETSLGEIKCDKEKYKDILTPNHSISQKNLTEDKDILDLKHDRDEWRPIKEDKSSIKNIKEYPLTGVQLAYLNGKNDSFELGKYNAHYYFEVETTYEVYRLQRAIQKLVKRHEILHSIFLKKGVQKVLEEVPDYMVEVFDFSRTSEEEKTNKNLEIRKELSHKIYDHETWPMFTFKVLEKGNNKKILFVSIDLMICDGDSLQILLNELAHYVKHDIPLQDFTYSYGQYVFELLKQKDDKDYVRAKKYWLSKIKEFPEFPQIPMLQRLWLCKNYSIKRKSEMIHKEEWQKIKRIAREKRVSPSAVLCAVYGMVLSKWSNQQDLLLNLTVFQRLPLHPEVEKLVGDFTKLLPLKIHMNSQNIWEVAKVVQDEILTDLEYLSFDGTEVMREITKAKGTLGKALLPVVFTCILFDSTNNYFNQLGELKYAVSQTPQVLLDNQIIEMESNLHISWDYVQELFDPEIIDAIFKEFVATIKTINESETVKVISNEDVKELWNEYNHVVQEAKPYTLQALFEEQVQRRPLAPAISYEGQQYSYEMIDKKANQIARYLCAQGLCGRNTRIGVLALRKPETIISILGILKTGAAYVPIEPNFPKERQKFILEDSGCSICLDDKLYTSLELDFYEDTFLGISSGPDSLAYIIYTSGSTGMPKGVMIQHKAVCNTIEAINEKINLSSDDCLIGVSSICFDLSVYDIFGVFSKGARLVMVKDPRNSKEMMDILQREKVSVWNSVPIIFSMVADYIKENDIKNDFSLREIMLSGDWIPMDLPLLSREIFPNAEIMSLGGATEASIWSIYYKIEKIDESWNSIPYGNPLKNQTMFVLDYNLNLCAPGVKGDIFIGGVGVAAGYNNDKKKTEKAFINHNEFGKIYRTGDIGVFHKEGYIEFLGRADNQIKIRGYRVELGEIETILLKQGEIAEAVVVLVDHFNHSKQLVGYLVSKDEKEINFFELKGKISEILPEYMIPTKFIQLSEMPLTSNGKIDKKQLPTYELTKDPENSYISPETEVQKKLVDIWEEIFQVNPIGIRDDFYTLGGDSIVLMKLIDKINDNFSGNISLEDILEGGDIEKLGELLE